MSYILILKHSDDSLHRVEVPHEEIADALTQIENRGTQIILIEKKTDDCPTPDCELKKDDPCFYWDFDGRECLNACVAIVTRVMGGIPK